MSPDATLRQALELCLDKELTFVAFRRPGAPVTLWAQRAPEVETVDGSLLWELNDVFLVAPFMLDPARIAMIRSDVDLSFGEWGSDITVLYECTGASRGPASPQPTTSAEEYTASVSKAVSAIQSGALVKVVLSRTLSAPLEFGALSKLFLQACTELPHAFVVLMNTPMHGTWLGASPERLVLAEEDHLRVDALAGTMSGDSAPRDPEAWGLKERNEQELVTASVLETFKRCGAQNVVAFPAETIGAGEVVHLRTRIEADLGEDPLSEVVLALHPTPAVCGTPRERALDFIQQQERHERRLYCGFWGPWYPDGGRTELYVNIRCLQQSGAAAVIYAGAGITEASDPRKEWEEAEQKAQTWLRRIETLNT